MEKKRTATETRILEATLACIERDGIEKATVRAISSEAGVNIAAINYHFRSKDQLIEEAMTMALDNANADWNEILSEGDAVPGERLESFANYILDGAQRYPKIVDAEFTGILNGEGDKCHAARSMANVEETLSMIFGDNDEAKAKATAFIGALFMPAITPELFASTTGFSLEDSKSRTAYARMLARLFLR
jgi:TetR/AcrR family transcriptional regulator, regulator of cefoperazone and chloramphenicol sensitivity